LPAHQCQLARLVSMADTVEGAGHATQPPAVRCLARSARPGLARIF